MFLSNKQDKYTERQRASNIMTLTVAIQSFTGLHVRMPEYT